MNTPWFTEMVAWLPGTLLGVVGGLFGGLAGFVLPSEERRKKWLVLVTRIYWLLLFYSVALLFLGLVALLVHQPYAVWYALLLPGCLGASLFSSAYFQLFYPSSRATGKEPNQAPEPTAPSGRGSS